MIMLAMNWHTSMIMILCWLHTLHVTTLQCDSRTNDSYLDIGLACLWFTLVLAGRIKVVFASVIRVVFASLNIVFGLVDIVRCASYSMDCRLGGRW